MLPIAVYRRVQSEGGAVVGVLEAEAFGMQQQARDAGVGGERAVLFFVAVVAVAQNGVEQVFEVAAQLVFASAVRVQL